MPLFVPVRRSARRALLGAAVAATPIALAAAGATPAGAPSPGIATASAAVPGPRLLSARCYPAASCMSASTVAPGGRLLLRGLRFPPRVRVLFPRRGGGLVVVTVRRRSPTSILVRVPSNARSGRVRLRTLGGRHSNASARLTVRARRPATVQAPSGTPTGTAFDDDGMWIWQSWRSEGGSLDALARRAKAAGVETVFVKSSDGANMWKQFTPQFVSALKRRGLAVCAWPYVYGRNPVAEARNSVLAAQRGADCLAIDAEGEYEGRYRSARTYMRLLRQGVGPRYPISLAGLPYVDYHGAFPYSVFLGPGGAQFNQPQMYWKAIGTSVDNVYAHTYRWNRIYQRPIVPLGQTWMNPSTAELLRFRALARALGAPGLSWWDWQETGPAGWRALAAPLRATAAPADPGWPPLRRGSRGDYVLWLQQHLAGAGATVSQDGVYGSRTSTAVRTFQISRGIVPTGAMDAATWRALLRLRPAEPDWAPSGGSGGGAAASASSARGAAPASAGVRGRSEFRHGGPPKH